MLEPTYFDNINFSFWDTKDMVKFYITRHANITGDALAHKIHRDLVGAFNAQNTAANTKRKAKLEIMMNKWKDIKKQIMVLYNEMVSQQQQQNQQQQQQQQQQMPPVPAPVTIIKDNQFTHGDMNVGMTVTQTKRQFNDDHNHTFDDDDQQAQSQQQQQQPTHASLSPSPASTPTPQQLEEEEEEEDATTNPKVIHCTNSNAKFRPMTAESKKQYNDIYGKMVDCLKWKLQSGRYVEDVLYGYGLTLTKESCVHSFILDTYDDQVRELFDDNEWKEILSKYAKNDPPLPTHITNLLTDLNKPDTNAIYDIIFNPARRRQDYNTRCICYAVESILLLFEADPNPLMSSRLEQWYQANIWTPVIGKLYGDVAGLECVLGESSSKVNRGKRQSVRMGSRCDMVLRKMGSSGIAGYGAAEEGADYDGDLGWKRIHEAELKLPKTLKDMMAALCNDCDCDEGIMQDIEVIGYYHSGTVVEFVTMDKPSGYVCRLSRTSQYQVPTTIKEIVKLLRLLSICLKMKLRVVRCIDTMTRTPLIFDSSSLITTKRNAENYLAATLTTPTRPTKQRRLPQKNPYLSD